MKVILCFCVLLAYVAGQRITTIQLDNVQYFVSRMNPYSPELNYFLAYQYCRSLGLQLASFETKEKAESMTEYLTNAGYSKYDFWTSGNRLGTGMFLWMSTGLPFNATFDYFDKTISDLNTSNLDPLDQNANTAPQRTARDSSSGLDKGCVILKAPNLRWAPQDCSAVKDFICEQTRCYYYNYGSIPVSSAQGRPIMTTTTTTTTTSLPYFATSTSKPLSLSLNLAESPSAVPHVLAALRKKIAEEHNIVNDDDFENTTTEEEDHHEEEEEEHSQEMEGDEIVKPAITDDSESHEIHDDEQETTQHSSEENEKHSQIHNAHEDEVTPVEQRLKQITEEIEKFSNAETDSSDIGRQSFFSLSDLIKNLRPNDKKPPQIDSDYSNTMRVLGETSSLVNHDDARKFKDSDNKQVNRALN